MILLVVVLMAGAPGAPAQRADLSAFRSASYRTVEKFADLPAAVSKRVSELIGEPIAEAGGDWNATDVVSPGDKAPTRRFVLAATSKSRALVVYEHGGIARHQHLLAFETPVGKPPRLVANVYVGHPSRLDDLRHWLGQPLTVADHL